MMNMSSYCKVFELRRIIKTIKFVVVFLSNIVYTKVFKFCTETY